MKTLLRQQFDVDADFFDLSALTNLILAQPLLGSTVKVEGNKTDPYAFLTVINLNEHKVCTLHYFALFHTKNAQDKPVIQQLASYIQKQAKRTASLHPITALMSQPETSRIGLILTERLINVPSEVVPPMYTMLLEEISWALEEKEPYNFTHYLIYSKTYREVVSMLNDEDSPKQKKQKRTSQKGQSEIFYFHPEDEILQRNALASGSFDYLKESGGSDAKRTFQEHGIKPEGHMVLIDAAKFEATVKALQEYFGQG